MEELNELFYREPYTTEFDAEVIECREGKNGYDLVLSDTAFYPEGGGQPADHGRINDIDVTDVKRKEGVILHHVEKPIQVGTTVHGTLDWARRFDHMQQHTGEHMLSGIIHKHFGYENVGFHMGDDTILIDLDGAFTWEELMDMEQEVNEAIWANEPIEIFFPTGDELSQLDYRSKKELTGKVRIVEVPGSDICACCGTHVHRTGEVGIVKCLSLEKHKEGVRVTMVCGNRALKDYRKQADQNAEVSHLLSAKIYETSNAVKGLQNADGEKVKIINALTAKYFALKAEQIEASDLMVLFEENVKPNELRAFGNTLLESGKAKVAALYTNGANGTYSYLLMSNTVDLRDAGKELNAQLNGRGGGKGDLIQGSYNATQEAIEAALNNVLSANMVK